MTSLDFPLTVLDGIGPKKAEDYMKMGILNLKDLIEYYPRDYEMSTGFTSISDLTPGETFMVRGRLITSAVTRRFGKTVMTSVVLSDGSGDVTLVFYNQPYLQKTLSLHKEVVVRGKTTQKYNRIQFQSPKFLHEKDLIFMEDKSVVPVYKSLKGVSQKQLRLAIAQGMDIAKLELRDFLPDQILTTYKLMPLFEAMNQVHYPDGETSLIAGRRRLVFDEFLLFQLGLMMIRKDQTKAENLYPIDKQDLYSKMIKTLPYKLTGAQERTMAEIMGDMTGPYAMNRLIQGDVGSGKTIIAALSMLLIADSGHQSVLMAPTEVLARQHYESLSGALTDLGLTTCLLVGSMTKKQKESTYDAIESGQVDVIIGTHALIQEGVGFKSLGLVITDEQHRFGVRQREIIAGKGHFPHVLVMSATPIPRTLGLILYGDMDVSIMDERPPGRQEIETYSVNTAYRNRLYEFMAKEVAKGHQCYVVCPKVEPDEDLDELADEGNGLTDVVTYSESIRQYLPIHIKVAYLHGRMTPSEKETIMTDYVEGKIHILVSTTVIEVGINVPNATIMMIENADRFGLAQLHQLRGRVGRGSSKSYCVLVTDSKNPTCHKRMEIMTKSTDGFVIAEKDLELRGHGDLLGIKQSGLPSFKLADIMEDALTLKEANEVARSLMDYPDLLKEEDYKLLKMKINRYINDYMSFIAL